MLNDVPTAAGNDRDAATVTQLPGVNLSLDVTAGALDLPWWRQPQQLLLGGVVAGVLAIVVIITLRMVFGHSGAQKTSDTIPLVSVLAPGRSTIDTTVNFTGGIVARYDMPIGVEGEGGRIVAVLAESGDHVRKGQVLARVEPTVVTAQVASLRATVDQTRAEAALAEADYQRAAAVVASVGALSREELDKRRSVVATTAARVKSAEAQLAEAEARLLRTEIKAPDDGLVLTRSVEVGQTAMAGAAPLFRLARGGDIEMRAQASEQDLPQIKLGQSVSVYLTGIAAPFVGKVRLVSAIIDPLTRLGEVRVSLPPSPDLRPGAFARGEVSIGTESYPIVPQTAVLTTGTVNFVYIVGADHLAVRRPVKIKGTQPRGIIIREGLTGTERVVTSAGAFLHEGEQVNLVSE